MIESTARIKGLLFDLDGVVYVGNGAIDGAAEALERLKSMGLPCRFTTNNTTRSLNMMHRKLVKLGLPIEKDECFGVLRAAQMYLKSLGKSRCYLLLNDGVLEDFAEIEHTEEDPDVIVMGDVGDAWNNALMEKLFQMVIAGAEMVTMHKGRYWQVEDGLRMDMGAYVAGLEYVTGKKATVLGKPEPAIFLMALKDMGLEPDQVLMIGDDLINDIGGAQAVGIKAVVVRTGKYREEVVQASSIEPDLIIDSIADLPDVLGG